MSPYKAGFELDGEPEEKKVRSETVTAEQNGTSFSYKKGFEITGLENFKNKNDFYCF